MEITLDNLKKELLDILNCKDIKNIKKGYTLGVSLKVLYESNQQHQLLSFVLF